MKPVKLLPIVALLLLVSSCSLMKFSIETPSEPLSSRQLTTRVMVRNFVEGASDQIVKAADSIIAMADTEPFYQINAIRWKLNAGTAYTRAGYQTVPESSLSDVWVLTLQWQRLMESRGDSLLGDYSDLAKETTDELASDIDQLAKKIHSGADYRKLKDFVEGYSAEHPMLAFSPQSPKTLRSLLEYFELPDSLYTSTVGTQAEVMSDFSDRMGRYQTQFNNSVEWEKDKLLIQWEEGNFDEELLARADSLSLMLSNLATIAKESPEMMGIIAVRIREELSPLVYSMNATLDSSLVKLDQQRAELQVYFDVQRAILAKEAEQMGNSMIETATDGLVKIIRKVIVYVILLILVMFGVPFALGYSFGRMRLRQKKNKQEGGDYRSS
ncbi:hypothetical protein [Mangrovibacterium diazotrophicum]|uniref:Chemotaxis protein n=1 Tax=Mangrovibacterium diazotrophicum TaxID=1261403 RepID=A0A419VVX0_9BACT|nr:hypothetical protein [Mangrovibacterium diazotrophicum]RKD86310.1 hypothetical protein BC643_4001 [Mangrovibacterium diazotrophicum]